MARNDPQMNIRVPPELKAKIERSALANGRSMNAEIVARLDASYRHQEDEERLKQSFMVASTGELADKMDALRRDIAEMREAMKPSNKR